MPEKSRHDARRMTNAELERYVETEQNPVPFTEENLSRDPTYNLPTAPAGTVFVLPDGKKTKPFPRTDYSTPEKASASKKKVEQWSFSEVVARGGKEIPRNEAEAATVNEGSAGEAQNDPFGPGFAEYSGRPKEAIEHLLKVREGHVPAAFHKEGLGDIDLPWGNEKFGLEHIIQRRNGQHKDGLAFVRRLPQIIDGGEVQPDPLRPRHQDYSE